VSVLIQVAVLAASLAAFCAAALGGQPREPVDEGARMPGSSRYEPAAEPPRPTGFRYLTPWT
jgi:hypothetical protein